MRGKQGEYGDSLGVEFVALEHILTGFQMDGGQNGKERFRYRVEAGILLA